MDKTTGDLNNHVVKILSIKHQYNDVYSQAFKKLLIKNEKTRRKQPTQVHLCDCSHQTCRGKFIRKFEWQTHCQWEMIRLGLIENVEELSKGKRFWELQIDDITF